MADADTPREAWIVFDDGEFAGFFPGVDGYADATYVHNARRDHGAKVVSTEKWYPHWRTHDLAAPQPQVPCSCAERFKQKVLTTDAELSRLRAENKAMLKDAARYRWLRSNHWKPRSRNPEIDAGYSCTFMAGSWLPSAGMDMDEAIDFFASAGSGEGK